MNQDTTIKYITTKRPDGSLTEEKHTRIVFYVGHESGAGTKYHAGSLTVVEPISSVEVPPIELVLARAFWMLHHWDLDIRRDPADPTGTGWVASCSQHKFRAATRQSLQMLLVSTVMPRLRDYRDGRMRDIQKLQDDMEATIELMKVLDHEQEKLATSST